MSDAKDCPPRPFSAPEGTWSPEEWPVDVQPVDENGVDLSLIDQCLSLTVDERLERNYQARRFVAELRKAGEALYGPPATDPETPF